MSDFLRLQRVLDKTGMKKTNLYALIKRGEFPEPIRIGRKISVWPEESITDWQREMIKAHERKRQEAEALSRG